MRGWSQGSTTLSWSGRGYLSWCFLCLDYSLSPPSGSLISFKALFKCHLLQEAFPDQPASISIISLTTHVRPLSALTLPSFSSLSPYCHWFICPLFISLPSMSTPGRQKFPLSHCCISRAPKLPLHTAGAQKIFATEVVVCGT